MQQAAVNIGGRLERLPISGFHWKLFTLLGIAMFFDGYDLLVAGLVIPSLRQVGWLDGTTTTFFVSLPLAAAAAGSFVSGYFGDRFGRRKLMKINVAIFTFGSLLCGIAPNTEALILFRTITGFGLGMQIVTGYSYMNEMTNSTMRGRFQASMAMIVNGGLPAGAIFAALVVPLLAPEVGWRLLFLISIIPIYFLFLSKEVLPESPRWLASVGRTEEADEIVRRIEAVVEKERGELLPVPTATLTPHRNLGWAALISGAVRTRFIMAILLAVFHLTGLYILVTWLPTILIASGLSFLSGFIFSAVTFSGSIFGPLLAVLIGNRFERRWMLVGAALVAAVTGLIYATQDTPTGLMIVGFILACAVNFISAVALATYIPEILPTGVRLRGVGSSFLVGRLASAASPFIVAAVLPLVENPLVIVTLVGGFYVLMAVVVATMGPNTTGRSLETLEGAVAVRP